jgi:hypothetical protein
MRTYALEARDLWSTESRLRPESEFHGHEILQRKGDFSDLSVEFRIALYGDALATLSRAGVEVVIRGVRPAGLRWRYNNPFHPHQVTMGYALDVIDRRLCARGSGHCTLVTADQNDETRHLLNRDLEEFRRFGTWGGDEQREFTRITKRIAFEPSHNNRMIQAADLVAFIYRRRLSGAGSRMSRVATSRLWSIIYPNVRDHYYWDPSRGAA